MSPASLSGGCSTKCHPRTGACLNPYNKTKSTPTEKESLDELILDEYN